MKRYYEDYWGRHNPPPLRDPLAPARQARLTELAGMRRGKRVLEVGCGAGDLLATLAARGAEAVGMDISGQALEEARRRAPEAELIEHSAQDLPWPVEAASFDLVVAFEVIEHLLEPRRLLLGAREALRPGGRLAVTTPYHGLAKNLVLALAAFDRHFNVEGDHIRFFSDRALRRLLNETGFGDIHLTHYGRAWPVWSGVFAWAVAR